MALPTSRTEFKNFCLRRLGKGVTEQNMSDEQIEDAIDYCLSYYADYHFDGSEKLFYRHQITSTDITNKYITLPENIMGVVNLFDISSALGTSTTDMFSITYQIALNDLWSLTSHSLVPYYMTRQHMRLMEEILVGKQPIRYNRHRNRLHIDMNWENLVEGYYVIVEAYEVVDPETFTDVYKDRWLLRYTTANIKRQWGENMKKYQGMPMAGGIMMNGQQIYNEAVEEINRLEDEMLNTYSIPPSHEIGIFIPFIINTSLLGLLGYLNEIWNYLPMV